MAGKDSKENPWADDQWGDFNDDDEESKKKKEEQAEVKDEDPHNKSGRDGSGKKLSEKLGDGLQRTKEGASRSMRKVKEGASVGLFWMKDKFRKPAAAQKPSPAPPSPPPPDSSPSP